jgi:DNA repair protein RadC
LIHAENLSEGTGADGVAEPLDNDDKITGQIKNALQTVGISLQDHLVIAGNEYFSYRQTEYLE